MMVSDEDIDAIHRENEAGGRDAAMVELRRRWPGINENAMPEVLDRVLAMPFPNHEIKSDHPKRKRKPRG